MPMLRERLQQTTAAARPSLPFASVQEPLWLRYASFAQLSFSHRMRLIVANAPAAPRSFTAAR